MRSAVRWMALAASLAAAGIARADSQTLLGAGETRGAFIERGTGARATALGGAFTALADDPSSLWVNPGGLAQLDAWRGLASYDLPGEGMSVSGLTLAGPLFGGGAGVGLTVFSFGSVDMRNAVGDKTGTESPVDLAASVGWAHANPGWLGMAGWTGASVEAVNENGLRGALVALSLGGVVPFGKTWTAGWALDHLGPAAQGFGLPAAARAGVAWRALSWAHLAADAAVPFKGNATFGFGAEVSPHPVLALRAGYRQATGLAAPGTAAAGVAAGIGLRWGDLGLDYVIEPLAPVAMAHRVALTYRQPRGGGAEPAATGENGKLLALAVAELSPQGVSASDAGVVADLLRSELVKTGAFDVVEKKNMDKILAEQAFQQTGCTSEECAVKLGRMLNAQRMVVGSFGKLMDAYFLSVRVVDIQSGGTIAADSVESRSVDELKKAITTLVGRITKAASR